MAIIAPGVCRFSVVGDLSGQDCINILDVEIDPGGLQSRAEDCFNVAGDILNNWNDHILPNLCGNYSALRVDWVDLDSADGTTGSRSSTSAETWPAPGGRSAAPMPNNVYIRIRKNLQGKNRQQRSGTLRLGGAAEEDTAGGLQNNVLLLAAQTNLNADFEAFKDGINGQNVAGETRNLCVVHTVNDVYSGHSIISTFQTQPVLGTIRRRMPGYGS